MQCFENDLRWILQIVVLSMILVCLSTCSNKKEEPKGPFKWIHTIYSVPNCESQLHPIRQTKGKLNIRAYLFDNYGKYLNYSELNQAPLKFSFLGIERNPPPHIIDNKSGEKKNKIQVTLSISPSENQLDKLEFIENPQESLFHGTGVRGIGHAARSIKILAPHPYSMNDLDYGGVIEDTPTRRSPLEPTNLIYRDPSIPLPQWIHQIAQIIRKNDDKSEPITYYNAIPLIVVLGIPEDVKFLDNKYAAMWKKAEKSLQGNKRGTFISLAVIMPKKPKDVDRDIWNRYLGKLCKLIKAGGTGEHYWGNLMFLSANKKEDIRARKSEWMKLYQIARKSVYGYWQVPVLYHIIAGPPTSSLYTIRFLLSASFLEKKTSYVAGGGSLWTEVLLKVDKP